jgi:hypothetical protein
VVALLALACSACSDDSPNTDAATLDCDDSSVRTAASIKLAEWIDQNMVKGNAVHVSAKLVVNIEFSANIPSTDSRTFVSADGASSRINGDPQGTRRCRANFVIAFREADGTLFGGLEPNRFTTEFLLASGPNGPQITLDDDEMPPNILDETSAIMGMEKEREHP